MKAFLFGHSHMWAIRRALAEEGNHPDLELLLCGTADFPGSLVYSNIRTGNLLLNSALVSALHKAGADPQTDVLVSSVQGNQCNALALLTDGVPFDVHIPGWPSGPSTDVPLVPYRALREAFALELSEFDAFSKAIQRLSYRAFIHLASPPPVPDAQFIRGKLPPLPSGEEPEIAAAQLRLKLWTMQCDMMREIVERNGGRFLDAPVQSRDSNGFLKEAYWKDSVHGNGAYGAVQLAQIEAALAELKQPAE